MKERTWILQIFIVLRDSKNDMIKRGVVLGWWYHRRIITIKQRCITQDRASHGRNYYTGTNESSLPQFQESPRGLLSSRNTLSRSISRLNPPVTWYQHRVTPRSYYFWGDRGGRGNIQMSFIKSQHMLRAFLIHHMSSMLCFSSIIPVPSQRQYNISFRAKFVVSSLVERLWCPKTYQCT